jgi:predicted transcriptional regulator
VQGISLFAARLHRLDFYVVLRKLIPKLQAFSQGIQETSMVRFYSSIYADDKVLIRQMSGDFLLTTSSHSGMDPADRAYLAKLIASDTGTPAPDAERRVDEVAARVKQDISRARSSAVILAFMAGAATLLGAIAAWAAAVTAGRYRDGREPIPYLFDWSSESRTRATERSILHQ